jgi:signal transduction histidine kinase
VTAAGPWRRPDVRSDAGVVLAALVLDLAVFSEALTSGAESLPGWQRLAILGYEVLGVALLPFRRRAPLLVFGLVVGHALIAATVPGLALSPTVTVAVALVAVAEYRRLRTSAAVLAVALLPFAASSWRAAVQEPDPSRFRGVLLGNLVAYALLALLCWALGRWRGRTSLRVAEIERRRQRAVADERARMARELHDIVSSAVTVMVLHAAGRGTWCTPSPSGWPGR